MRSYKVVRQTVTLPVQSRCHLRKSLRLNQVVECKWREHGSISVHLSLNQQRGTTHTIELDLGAHVGRSIVHVGHQTAVRRHLRIALEQNVVLAHFSAQLPRSGAVDPVVEVVRALRHGLLVLVVVALEAVGGDDGHVVGGEVLDERRWGLDDVGVHPEHPGCGGAQSGEEQRVARLGHGCTASLLVLHLVALGLVLRLQGDLSVLAQDRDSSEALALGAGLGLGDLRLECGVGGIALFGLGYYEAERDEVVGVAELQQVFPVAVVEARQRCEDQDGLVVLHRGARGCDIVHVVMHDGRRGLWSVRFGLAER